MAKELASSLLMVIMLACFYVPKRGATDAEILLKFKNSLMSNDSALDDWEETPTPCTNDTQNRTGVLCAGGIVIGLRLENMSLMGMIDIDTLAQLKGLRSLSLKNNRFEGPMPSVKKLTLRTLYLSHNKFNGEIPPGAFAGMNQLKKVHLARNQFTGKIPKSLSVLQKLLELNLEGNNFEGTIPDFPEAHLNMLNVSYNQLMGRIPTRLSNFNASSFEGNEGLCGKPLEPCKSSMKKICRSAFCEPMNRINNIGI